MKYLITILSVLLFACQKRPADEKVTLQILTKEIYFNQKYQSSNNGRPSSLSNYENKFDREKASSILSFRIFNSTRNKYVFVIDEDNLYSDTMSFEIFDKKKNPIICGYSNITFNSNLEDFYVNNKTFADSLNFEKDRLLGISSQFKELNNLYKKGSFILYPNQSKTFRVIIRLPILREINGKEQITPCNCKLFENINNFRLRYNCRPELLIAGLQDFQKEDLKRNGISIYSGELFSNYIPLLAR